MNDYFESFFFGIGAKKGYKGAAADARLKRNVSWWNIFCQLINLVANRFKPKEGTMPETMDWRFLMLCLINTNKAGIIEYEGEIYNGNIIGGSNFSRYGHLINCNVVDFMGKPYGIKYIPNTPGLEDVANCGIVFMNELNSRPISRIIWFAQRLTELQSSISAAISNLKGTVVIRCEKEQEKVIARDWSNAGEGVPVILKYDGSSGFGNVPELMCNPQTGDVLKVLMETYDKEFARFCGEFGISNNQVMNKLSGISQTELEQNNVQNYIVLHSDLNCLNKYFDRANKLFGTKIEIEINQDMSYNNDINSDKEENDDEFGQNGNKDI